MDRRNSILSLGLTALTFMAAMPVSASDAVVCDTPAAVASMELPSPFGPVNIHTEHKFSKWRHGFHKWRTTWDKYFEVYPDDFDGYEAVKFDRVREEPAAFLHHKIEFDLYFAKTGSFYKPFLSPYVQDLFVNFSAWSYGADLWLKEARGNIHPLFYSARDKDDLVKKLSHLPMFTPIHVWAEVGSKSENSVWLEVKRIEVIPEIALTETTLRQIELGFMQYDKKRYEISVQSLETALKLELPVQAEARVYAELGRSYFELHQYAQARNALVNAVVRDENNIAALLLLARTDLRIEKADEAKEAAQRVVTAEPSNAIAHAELGLALGMLGDVQGGYTELEFAQTLAPRHQLPVAFRNKAKLALIEGKLELARDELNRAVILLATDVELKLELGDVYVKLGDWDKARLNYTQARDLEPQRAEPYFKVAFVLKSLGDAQKKAGNNDGAKKLYEEALENIDNAIMKDHLGAPAHLLKVDILKALGRDEDAKKAAEAGYKLIPGNAALQALNAPPPPAPVEAAPVDAKPADAKPADGKPDQAATKKPAPPVIEDVQGNEPVPIKVPGPR